MNESVQVTLIVTLGALFALMILRDTILQWRGRLFGPMKTLAEEQEQIAVSLREMRSRELSRETTATNRHTELLVACKGMAEVLEAHQATLDVLVKPPSGGETR